MNELQAYLAIREAAGVNNKDAMDEVVRLFNERNIEKTLRITPAMRSRAKNGLLLRGEKRKLVNKAINLFFEQSGQKIEKTQSIESFLEAKCQEESVANIIAKYGQKRSRLGAKASAKVSAVSKYSAEDEALLLGVWAQINYSLAKSELGPPRLRVALKLIHYSNGRLKTYCIGKRSAWDGEAEIVNNCLHITERLLGDRFGEIAHFVYRKKNKKRDIAILEGFIQSVEHYGFSHIFSGATVLRKMDDLTSLYGSNLDRFKRDSIRLQEKYCGYIEEDELMTAITEIPDLRTIVHDYLNYRGGRLYHTIAM